MKDTRQYFLILLLVVLSLTNCKEPASLSALLISDNPEEINNITAAILENSGLFDVDIHKGGEASFDDYDVIVLNLENAEWSDDQKSAFEAYLRSGGGAVALGATMSAFANWPEVAGIFGIDHVEQLRKSNQAYEYQLINSDVEHPTTTGLQKKWMHGNDYMLYLSSDLKPEVEVLSSAMADSIHGGDNELVPVIFTNAPDKGRVFNCTMSYAAAKDRLEALQCVGFITTLQRGAEWAATGVVSQEAPIDFPNAVSTHYWTKLEPFTLDEILERAARYEIGKSKKYLTDFSKRVRDGNGKAETYRLYEDKILAFLESDATVDSKKYMCRELSWMGSDKSISVLEKLVNDKDLSESASYALQRLRM